MSVDWELNFSAQSDAIFPTLRIRLACTPTMAVSRVVQAPAPEDDDRFEDQVVISGGWDVGNGLGNG